MAAHDYHSAHAEELRIRAAYAKRPKKDDRYSWFNAGYVFMLQEQERLLLELLKRYHLRLDRAKILEIGCGTGYWLRQFIKWGVHPENVVGIDLLADRVAEAKRLCPQEVRIECGNAAQLFLPDAAFDLILQSTVFTSVLDWKMKQQIAAQMLRVLKRDGLIVWYDYYVNNPRNADVRGVKREEISQLFPGCRIELRRVTLAPPIARWLAPYSLLACQLLGKIPCLATHYLGVVKKAHESQT